MFGERAEIRLGLGRRVLIVSSLAVRPLSGSSSELLEVLGDFDVRVVPEHRVRHFSSWEAMEAAREVLGRGQSIFCSRHFLERMGFLGRAPSLEEVAHVLMDRFRLVELEDDRGRWDGPGRKQHQTELEPAVERGRALTWVAVTVVDDEEQPLAGARFRLRLPDASTIAGALDNDGHTRVDDIEPGKCWLELTDVRRGVQR